MMRLHGGRSGPELLTWIENKADQEFAQAEDWSRRYSTSLAVGNGGALLAYFSAAAHKTAERPDWIGTMFGTAVGAVLLVGLIAAGLVPWFHAIERRRLSALTAITADFVRDGEPENWSGGDELVLAVDARDRAYNWSNRIQAISAAAFVVAVGSALVLGAL